MTTACRRDIWTRPALLAQVLHERKDGYADLALTVPALEQAAQALKLEQLLAALPGVKRTDINLPTQRIRLTFKPEQLSLHTIIESTRRVGLEARPISRDFLHDPQQQEMDNALKRLLVAGIFGMQAMMFAFVLYIQVIDDIETTTIQLFRWLGLLMACPVVGYSALPFFRHAFADIKARRVGIDVPIALAILLIFMASLFSTITGSGDIWFDSVCMLVFVLLLGRFLEQRIRHRHLQARTALEHKAPLTVSRQTRQQTYETIALSEIEIDDILHIPEGAMLPVDGVLMEALAQLDTSLFTGEAEPQLCYRHEAVQAGSIALLRPMHVKVTQSGSDSSLNRLSRLLQEAHAKQASGRRKSRFIPWFVSGILIAAALTCIGWLVLDPARAFNATVAVLVVTCPCAFALAIPATSTRAVTLLSEHNIQITRPHCLYELPAVSHVFFDKTGTLTRAGIDADDSHADGMPCKPEHLAIALALAAASTHPLSLALRRRYAHLSTASVTNIQALPGVGMEGTFNEVRYRLGRNPAVDDEDAGRFLYLSQDQRILARFTVGEQLREGTAQAVAALQQRGLKTVIMSGDAPARVAHIARQLHIDTWHARQLPADKYALIDTLQQQGQAVLAVGDGNNDTAALARAQVSVSLLDATDNARHEADILLEKSLMELLAVLAMSTAAKRTLWQGRAWGLGWNSLALPFAALGFIPPWVAAIGMSLSSVIVILNVLRMKLLPTFAH